MAHIWITGARGFIGRHLARWLANQGHTVHGIGHGPWTESEISSWGLSTWLNGEISTTNLGQMRQTCGIPDSVFHLAGGSSVSVSLTSPHEDFVRTVVSTAELLEWVRQQAHSTRVIAISSAAVYGAGNEGKIDENVRLTPSSPYGTHKLMMEELCRSYAKHFGLQIVLPRLFSVYGAGLKKQLLWDLCSQFSAGGMIKLGGTGNELRDWTEVNDVAQALYQIARVADETAPVMNIATGVATTVRDIASLVASHWEGSDVKAKISFSGSPRRGDPFSLVANISRMNAYGIESSVSVAQGIAEYVGWFRNKKEFTD
jgi:UDP-glucose 4-epimerase